MAHFGPLWPTLAQNRHKIRHVTIRQNRSPRVGARAYTRGKYTRNCTHFWGGRFGPKLSETVRGCPRLSEIVWKLQICGQKRCWLRVLRSSSWDRIFGPPLKIDPAATIQQRSSDDPAAIQQRSSDDPATIQRRSSSDPATIQQRSSSDPAATIQRRSSSDPVSDDPTAIQIKPGHKTQNPVVLCCCCRYRMHSYGMLPKQNTTI